MGEPAEPHGPSPDPAGKPLSSSAGPCGSVPAREDAELQAAGASPLGGPTPKAFDRPPDLLTVVLNRPRKHPVSPEHPIDHIEQKLIDAAVPPGPRYRRPSIWEPKS